MKNYTASLLLMGAGGVFYPLKPPVNVYPLKTPVNSMCMFLMRTVTLGSWGEGGVPDNKQVTGVLFGGAAVELALCRFVRRRDAGAMAVCCSCQGTHVEQPPAYVETPFFLSGGRVCVFMSRWVQPPLPFFTSIFFLVLLCSHNQCASRADECSKEENPTWRDSNQRPSGL